MCGSPRPPLGTAGKHDDHLASHFCMIALRMTRSRASQIFLRWLNTRARSSRRCAWFGKLQPDASSMQAEKSGISVRLPTLALRRPCVSSGRDRGATREHVGVLREKISAEQPTYWSAKSEKEEGSAAKLWASQVRRRLVATLRQLPEPRTKDQGCVRQGY